SALPTGLPPLEAAFRKADAAVFLRAWPADARQGPFFRLAARRLRDRVCDLHARRRLYLCRIYRTRLRGRARSAPLSLRLPGGRRVGDGARSQVVSQQWTQLRPEAALAAPARSCRSLCSPYLQRAQRCAPPSAAPAGADTI